MSSILGSHFTQLSQCCDVWINLSASGLWKAQSSGSPGNPAHSVTLLLIYNIADALHHSTAVSLVSNECQLVERTRYSGAKLAKSLHELVRSHWNTTPILFPTYDTKSIPLTPDTSTPYILHLKIIYLDEVAQLGVSRSTYINNNENL